MATALKALLLLYMLQPPQLLVLAAAAVERGAGEATRQQVQLQAPLQQEPLQQASRAKQAVRAVLHRRRLLWRKVQAVVQAAALQLLPLAMPMQQDTCRRKMAGSAAAQGCRRGALSIGQLHWIQMWSLRPIIQSSVTL